MDQDESALQHMSCTTIVMLFAGSIVLWIIAGYSIGRLLGAW